MGLFEFMSRKMIRSYFGQNVIMATMLSVILTRNGVANGFVATRTTSTGINHPVAIAGEVSNNNCIVSDDDNEIYPSISSASTANGRSRRNFLSKSISLPVGILSGIATSNAICVNNNDNIANAAVGKLPEYATTNAILQGITVNVADQSQQDAMINFLDNGFGMKELRKRIKGTVEETWMGFGPEELNVPKDFETPISSFNSYGGHASICIRYDSSIAAPLYRIGADAPGNNIAYLQLGVPVYRITAMVKADGNIIDAFGIVNVVSPSGLPIRGIVGINPDPMMFVAINCENVEKSFQFYQSLGFTVQEYPYARPNKGMGDFEPPQPIKSIYMSLSPNCMGVLLLPNNESGKKNVKVKVNPVIDSLRVVYAPNGDEQQGKKIVYNDPSSVSLAFQSATEFEKEERNTR